MAKNRIVLTLVSLALAGGVSVIGASSASAATPACNAARTAVTNYQTQLAESKATRDGLRADINALEATRANQAAAGNVEAVGQSNVVIGARTPLLTTMESQVAQDTARLNRAKSQKAAAC